MSSSIRASSANNTKQRHSKSAGEFHRTGKKSDIGGSKSARASKTNVQFENHSLVSSPSTSQNALFTKRKNSATSKKIKSDIIKLESKYAL
jgi:hypothetical protein